MPIQPPPLETAEGIYTPPPTLLTSPRSPSPPDSPTSLKSLSQTDLIARLTEAESLLSSYRTAASDLLAALAFTPDMTEAFYARSLRALLSSALLTLESVDALSHIECSFPCVSAEMPSVELSSWRGLDYSVWSIDWAPHSWWVSASVTGTRWGFGFDCLTTVSRIRVSGSLECAFARDMTSVRVGFRESPNVDMAIESSVGWGVVPLPLRESIEELVREEILNVVRSRLVDDDMVVVLRRKVGGVSEGDLHEARLQARRAGSVILRANTLL